MLQFKQKKMLKSSAQAGFTLLELLVVISIISFLASILLVSVVQARVKARNSKRLGDIEQIAKALSAAQSLGSSALPDSSTVPNVSGWVCISSVCNGSWSYPANTTVDNYLSQYIKKPIDPSDSTRGYNGYIFNSNNPGWAGPPVLPPGGAIIYLLEPTTGATTCGAGIVSSIQPSYTQCFLPINQ